MISELHPKVDADVEQAWCSIEDRGCVDLTSVWEAASSLEDSPEKARKLAQLGAAALWYATVLRQEEDGAGTAG